VCTAGVRRASGGRRASGRSGCAPSFRRTPRTGPAGPLRPKSPPDIESSRIAAIAASTFPPAHPLRFTCSIVPRPFRVSRLRANGRNRLASDRIVSANLPPHGCTTKLTESGRRWIRGKYGQCDRPRRGGAAIPLGVSGAAEIAPRREEWKMKIRTWLTTACAATLLPAFAGATVYKVDSDRNSASGPAPVHAVQGRFDHFQARSISTRRSPRRPGQGWIDANSINTNVPERASICAQTTSSTSSIEDHLRQHQWRRSIPRRRRQARRQPHHPRGRSRWFST
jgi:hypothetical protein